MILISFLFALEGESLLINIPLREYAGFDKYLSFLFRVQIDFNCIISLFAFFALLLFVIIQAIIEFIFDVRI